MIKKLNVFVIFFTMIVATPISAQDLACGNDIKFFMPGMFKESSQNTKVSEKISIDSKQYLSDRNVDGYIIAVNTTCQTLSGHQYSGSPEEWVKFFESSLSRLSKDQYKELTFTLIGEDEAVMQNTERSKEFILSGKKGDNKQILKNLAFLSSDMHSILTISISGNEAIEDKIANLFQNLVTYVEKNSQVKN